MKTISIVGVGIMGRGMAINLQKKGYSLRLYTRNPEKIKDLKDERTIITSNLKEAVDQSDIVILCLTEDPVVENVFFSSRFSRKQFKSCYRYGHHIPRFNVKNV
jgi:3-hydroxyisobutyrate dehydrogenase